MREAWRIQYLSLAPLFLCGRPLYSIQGNALMVLLSFIWAHWQDEQFGTVAYFWSELQIAVVAKIQTDLYWWNNSNNYSGNCSANTFSSLLSCGVQNAAKISWYATQLWVPCCTHRLIMWWGISWDWDKKTHTTRF